MNKSGLFIVALVVSSAAWAQNVQPPRPMLIPRALPVAPAVPETPQLATDYEAQYRSEHQKNKHLRSENASLKQQLDDYTSRGGSLVHAYCESTTMSRNTAGDQNDCTASHYSCEPVSGLCRTSAANTSECSGGYLWCAINNQCVPPAPDACSGSD